MFGRVTKGFDLPTVFLQCF